MNIDEIKSIGFSNADSAFDQISQYNDLQDSIDSHLQNVMDTIHELGGSKQDCKHCERFFRERTQENLFKYKNLTFVKNYLKVDR